jgi:GTP-binding protein
MFTLAIVGRPNVGKSTLFNRLAGKQLAIVDDRPGITRDWREAEGWLYDRQIRLIDTAGLEESFDSSIEGRMRRQTEAGIAQADAILFLIDGRSGLTPLDEHFARWLRKRKIPVVLGVNKCENEKAVQAAMAEAYGLGLGDPLTISAAHGLGIDEIYHALTPYFPEEAGENDGEDGEAGEEIGDLDALEGSEDFDFATAAANDAPEGAEEEKKSIKLAIVGRPNVGKSTLLNAIVGDERVMTGPEAGITRDAIAVQWEYEGHKFRLVDTAGMRKRARVTDRIEKMAVEDTLRAIRLAQIVVLVVDANTMLEKQDLQIAEHIVNEGRALVIAVNKWDTVADRQIKQQELRDFVEHSLAQVRDVPIVTISAINGRNIDRLMDEALRIYDVWNIRTGTARMNRWLAAMESQNPPPMGNGRPNRLKYMTQIKSRPPTFALWVSQPDELPDTYRRYIINGIRRDFNIPGVPVRLLVRASKNPYTNK